MSDPTQYRLLAEDRAAILAERDGLARRVTDLQVQIADLTAENGILRELADARDVADWIAWCAQPHLIVLDGGA